MFVKHNKNCYRDMDQEYGLEYSYLSLYLEIAEGVAGVVLRHAVLLPGAGEGALDEDLPAVVGLLAAEDEEGEGRGLQLVLVEGEVLDHHRLLVGAGELEGGVCRPLGQVGGAHIWPECLGQWPEPNSKTWKHKHK